MSDPRRVHYIIGIVAVLGIIALIIFAGSKKDKTVSASRLNRPSGMGTKGNWTQTAWDIMAKLITESEDYDLNHQEDKDCVKCLVDYIESETEPLDAIKAGPFGGLSKNVVKSQCKCVRWVGPSIK